MRKRGLLIFDYDGTIADSFDYVINGFNQAASVFGIKKRTKSEVSDLYLKNIFLSILSLGIRKSSLNDFMKIMREGYDVKKVKPFDGMKSIINNLKKEFKIFIITSNFKKTVISSLNKNAIKVDGVLGKEQGTSKVKKINFLKSKYPSLHSFYIGDTVGDIKEAKKAKITNIAVTWGFNKKEMLLKSNPDYIISKPSDLIRIFKNK